MKFFTNEEGVTKSSDILGGEGYENLNFLQNSLQSSLREKDQPL